MRFFVATLLSIAFFNVDAQDTIYVNSSATGLQNGSSWQDAFTNLQTAIDSSKFGDQVWVASGLYFPSTDYNGLVPTDPREKTFHLKNGIQVYGGFIGNETLRPSDPLKNPTVLSGDIGVYGNISDNCYHVITNKDLRQGYIYMEGFYVEKGGSANGPYGSRRGAGIYDANSAVTYSKLDIRDNEAESGGGVYAVNSESTFINCYIHNNRAGSHGGGFSDYSSNTTIRDCKFEANTANVLGGAGGGYFGLDCQVDISYCTFVYNQANGGGGFFLGSSYLSQPWPYSKMHHIVCMYNSAQTGGGGSIHARPIFTSNLIIASNIANIDGGGLSVSGHVSINNSEFHNNKGGGVKIGLNTFGNDIQLHNVTITHNTPKIGYQISTSENDKVYFFNSVVNGKVYKDSTATIEFDHCLIPNSKPGGIWDLSIGKDKGGNIDTVPLFFAESKRDYRLWKCSPGVDAGDSTKLALDWLDIDNDNDTTEYISTDIDGFKRVNKSQLDMGAHEYHNVKFFYSDSLFSYSYLDTATSYSWINCNTGLVVSTAKTLQHLGDTSITYALVIDKGGCVDTSECFRVDQNLAVKQVPPVAVSVELFPNPVKDHLFVKQSNNDFDKLAIYNMQGQLVRIFELNEYQEFEVPMDFLQKGIYILHLSGPNQVKHSSKISKL